MGCPSFCQSMVREGDASTRQGNLTRSPMLALTTEGSFLYIFNLQNTGILFQNSSCIPVLYSIFNLH